MPGAAITFTCRRIRWRPVPEASEGRLRIVNRLHKPRPLAGLDKIPLLNPVGHETPLPCRAD